jgi:hypothetical protein
MTTKPLGKPELEKLADALRRLRGTAAYPPTADELFKAAGVAGNPAELATRPTVTPYLRTSAKRGQKHAGYYDEALVFLPEHLDDDLACNALLLHLVRLARTDTARIHDIASLKEFLPKSDDSKKSLQSRFAASMEQRLQSRSGPPLPSEVAMLPAGTRPRRGGKRPNGRPFFFLISDVLPVVLRKVDEKPPAHRSDGNGAHQQSPFPEVFAEAFNEIDQQTGRRNYVLLHDLRQRLAAIPRPDFDAGLNELRRSQKYSLDSADGRHIRLTPEQIDAGIREAGSVLVYVARR